MRCRVVSKKDILSSMRFDGSYHNAEANIYDTIIRKHSKHNLDFYCVEIFTSGRKKRVYTDAEHGVPFLSNSDVTSLAPFNTCKYTSKKYGFDHESVLKAGMVLTGRVGAIGQTAFVPESWEKVQAIGSDNIIRIHIKPEFRNGFIYAYLASRVGNLSFWKHATGGVQPFITDKMVGQLPIPVMPDAFQEKVDNLIQKSARLRDEANNALTSAKNKLMDYCEIPFSETNKENRIVNVSISKLRESFNTRLDPSFFVNEGITWFSRVKRKTIKLGDCNIKSWYPGIFKRVYVSDGLPYIKGSELFDIDPFRKCEKLSRTRTPNIEELWLKEGMLMVSCAGACGLSKIITKEYEEKNAIGSPDIIRIVSNDSLYTAEYIFAYMQLPPVFSFMQSLKYGSVIERFDISNLENMPIVEPTQELSRQITVLVALYLKNMYEAYKSEEQAIQMVEHEIEKWNS